MQHPIDGKNILVLDRNRHYLAILRSILRQIGECDVVAFNDVERAHEYLHAVPVDVAIAVHDEAGVNGIEFALAARYDDQISNPFMPIIVITPHASREFVRDATNSGVDLMMVKPIRPRDLESRVRQVLTSAAPCIRLKCGYFGPERRRNPVTPPNGVDQRVVKDLEVVPRPPELLRYGARAVLRYLRAEAYDAAAAKGVGSKKPEPTDEADLFLLD